MIFAPLKIPKKQAGPVLGAVGSCVHAWVLIWVYAMNNRRSYTPLKDDFNAPDFWLEALAARAAQQWRPWSEEERKSLVAFQERVGAPSACVRSVAKLADPEALVVVTGQQAGLFLSPLYTLYKAMGAILWARRLEDWLKRPVAPVFWIASEDHDFEEVRRVHYLNREHRCVAWEYAGEAPPEGTSVFDVPVTMQSVGPFLDRLEEDLSDSEFKGPLLHDWRKMIELSENMEDFFARAMARLLGAEGLILAPSRLDVIRRRAAPVLRREIAEPGASTARLVGEAEAMRERGEEAPIHREGAEANFFLYHKGRRCKVAVASDGFDVLDPETGESCEGLAAERLMAMLEKTPENFSPNVASRPVVQDAAFPAIAMVGGPGEVRYLSMLHRAGVYEFFGVVPSVVVPRPRILLVEPAVQRQLEKHETPLAILEREDWSALERHLLRTADFGDALERTEGLESVVREAFVACREDLPAALLKKPEVDSALKKTLGSVENALRKMHGRVEKAVRQEEERSGTHLDRLLEALRPDGAPQERVLGILAPFLVHHGPTLPGRILQALDVARPELRVLLIKELMQGEGKA